MSEQEDLAPTLQELMARMARMQAELDSLKGRANALPQPTGQARPPVSTTRRKLLRRLAGGLVAGLTVGGVVFTNPHGAEAKITSNPTGNGLTGRVGMLVMPPGGSVTGTLVGGSTRVGLLVNGDTSFNLSASTLTPTVNSAIIAYTSNNGSAIAGLTQTGTAIYGQSDTNYGVYGTITSANYAGAAGVYGISSGSFQVGVQGTNDNGHGVFGVSNNAEGVAGYTINGAGIYGGSDGLGYAGYFDGKVQITGPLTKPSGSFKIDHPLDPENKYLYHSFVESPDMMNIYNGIVSLDEQGQATVEMPDWFEALNFDFRYQLTCLGEFAPVFIAEKLTNRRFKIAGGKNGQEVSWQVTGIRQDEWAKAHRIPVEEVKNDKEKGKYLHPELFRQPEERSVQPRLRPLK